MAKTKKTTAKKETTPKKPAETQNSHESLDKNVSLAKTDDPDLPKLKAAVLARQQGLFQNARDLLQEILKRRQDWMPARRELALLYFSTENYIEAEKFLLNEAKLFPKDEWIKLSLCHVYRQLGNAASEITAIKNFTQLQFNEALIRRLFELQRDTGDLKSALDTVLALRAFKDTIELEVANAKLLNLLKRNDEALKLCDELLKKRPIPAGTFDVLLTVFLGNANNPLGLLDKIKSLKDGGYEDPFLYIAIARALHRMDKNNEAIDYLKKALAIDDKHYNWWYDLSLIQRQNGNIEDSQASLMRALKVDPLNPTGIRVHGVEHKYKLGDEAHKQLNLAHAYYDSFKDQTKVELNFALAKAHEDFDELKTAFKYYENAGKLQSKLTPYWHPGTIGLLKMTRDRVGPATYANFKEPRCETDKPVFILGMPRSGTSLVEQVVATHTETFGAGELKLLHRVLDGVTINKRMIETSSDEGVIPTFIPGVDVSKCRTLSFKDRGDLYLKATEAIAKHAGNKDAKRIIDKMPGNYFWTGVIPFILPNAKIIHTQRHPLDNCLSLYRIFFPDGMPWSYDLRNLGKVYRTYFEHMTYWEANLPKDMMLTINYEVMVENFEDEAKKIIAHIGLPWDDACLKFYETDRQVKTASLNQVRKPIYSTSVGRWKKYEDHLKPLIQELGPLIKVYDDKVKQKLDAIKLK